jgi:Zn-dependent M16 (insulinase) family peptidase
MLAWRSFGILVGCMGAILSSSARGDTELAKLKPDQKIASFKTANIYENELGQAVGARFRHIPSGFILDLLRIQSVPQAFMWVNSFPPSDKGEPHTCEHLMLGKGTRGRYVASLEEMSLGNSSAFTGQLQTCYHFHTAGGASAFFNLMEAKLMALVHPDFSDEEIRREVCNIGYSTDLTNFAIRLEEKGTVYQEMLGSYEKPWGNLGRELGLLLYGKGHPLSYDAGGYPADIRNMVPDDMRKFIAKNYHLSNMGEIISIPDDMSLEDCLTHISNILKKVEPDAKEGIDPASADENLPVPIPSPEGKVSLVSFPSQSENEPGLLVYAWPADLQYDNNEAYILDLLMTNLASGETSNLYHKFIDSQTRVMDLGSNSVFEWISSDIGHAIYLGFGNVKVDALNEATIDSVRSLIIEEISKIAKLPDGSSELKSFNERALNRIIEHRRDLRNFLNTPPGFGFRGTSSRWLDHLKHLQKSGGFTKRLTLDDELKFAEEKLSSNKNFWRDYIAKWGLLKKSPYAVASRPDSNLLAQTGKAHDERIKAFIDQLEMRFDVNDEQKAVSRFKIEYDAKTRIIDSTAAAIPMPKFIDNPPLTLDDQLHYRVDKLPGGGDLVTSTFENMTSATVGLAFHMDVIPESLLLYTSVLPSLLTEVGAIKERTYAYDEMKEALRREIMDLQAYYSVNYRDERVELVFRASGGDSLESLDAMKWLEAILFQPLWTKENLPRLRDVIDQVLGDFRNTMRGPEENWVDDPANAYWRQSDPLILSTSSFLTEIHSYQRLRWLLKDSGSPETAAEFSSFMRQLSAVSDWANRDKLDTLLAVLTGTQKLGNEPQSEISSIFEQYNHLSKPAYNLASDAVHDLTLSLAEVPDSSLSSDWKYLCAQMDADLQVLPEKTLENLNAIMNLIRRRDNVRGFMIANSVNQNALRPLINSLVERLQARPSQRQTYDRKPLIISRLQEHSSGVERPIFVGLVNDNTRSGVHINSAPCASFLDDDPEMLLRFLSARLYGGGGAHSMFMQTWSAGMAYSNGLRSNEFTGRMIYYAERCPDLAQTMQFVVNELKNATRDSSLAEYAVAQAFAAFRSGSRYEARGEAIAADLADGVSPDTVRRFRQGILALRNSPALYDKLWSRMENVYGQILPGYGPRADSVDGAIYYIIGPESQFRSYEKYIHSVEGNFPVFRLYPRDYWIVRPNTTALDKPQ